MAPPSNAQLEAHPPDDDCRLSPPRQLRPRLGNPGTHPTRRPRQSRTPCTEQPPLISHVFWVLRTGAPWRDLPPDYGHWGSTYNRFRNWQKDGAWQRLLDTLANDPDLEWLMIDGSYVKVHQHGTGAVGGNQAVGRTKGD